jgi:ABC-type proline/glycine betaine transport system permease subunit
VGLTERRGKLPPIYRREKAAVWTPISQSKQFANEAHSSLINADRVTHLRIVVVALIVAIVVSAIGAVAARNENENPANSHAGAVAVKQHKS